MGPNTTDATHTQARIWYWCPTVEYSSYMIYLEKILFFPPPKIYTPEMLVFFSNP